MKKIFALVPLLFACTEAVENAPDSGSDASSQDVATPKDSAPPNETGPMDAGACGLAQDASLGVVVNEIRAKGAEFVELYNPTSGTIDLSGVALADTESDSGCPKTSEQLVFPSGTQIPSGGYVVVDTSAGDAGGPFQNCHDAGYACFQATWGVSNSSGESVWVLQGQTLAATAYYPPSAVDSGQSYGRIPNGTGNFTTCTPTPAAANVAAP